MKNRSLDTLMFLTGLFAMTEVYVGGFSAISELVIFVIAPFVFISDLRNLKRDGFMHRLLRDDFGRVKWFFVGYSLSLVINIFIFQRGSARHSFDTSLFSEQAMESTVNSVLFWTGRIPHWLYLPVRGWYLSTSAFYSLSSAFAVIIVCLFGSGGSGRAATLCAMATFILLVVGGKTIRGLWQLRKKMVIVLVVLGVVALMVKQVYQHLAESGALGEGGAKKFEQQTKQGKDVFSILVAGRGEFFAGLYCAIRKPIVGYGPWAIDWDGIAGDFLRKYGSPEDYESYVRSRMSSARKISVIPSHSCIVGFWTWYGIFGLILWLYILRLYWKTITVYFASYPPWFGCVATILPTAVWDAFFSPYGNRIMMALFFAMCLFLKAVHEKRIPPGGTIGLYQPMEWK